MFFLILIIFGIEIHAAPDMSHMSHMSVDKLDIYSILNIYRAEDENGIFLPNPDCNLPPNGLDYVYFTKNESFILGYYSFHFRNRYTFISVINDESSLMSHHN